jgi:protein-S-isoprenylcysteine O-methyltransferase Ste14
MNIAFTIICSVWLISEIILNRIFRSDENDKKNADKNSLNHIWLTIILAACLSIIIFSYSIVPIFSNSKYRLIGLVLIIVGMTIRIIAVFTLGKMFTVDVTIRKDHKVKKDGIYRCLRHPSYAGSLLSFIGFGLYLNNWLSLFVITIPMFVVFIMRIKIEENLLIAELGSDYTEYKKGTYRLIPFIY